MHRVSAQGPGQEERDVLASIVDHVGPLVVLDPDGHVALLNRAAERLLGGEVSEPVRQAFARAKADAGQERTLEWFDTDEGRCLIGWRGSAIPGDDGRPRRVVVEGIDLTKAHEASEEAEARTAELEGANEELTQFASIV